MAEEEPKKRGPKGGMKHQPGRGHDRKSAGSKKKRFARKAANKRERQTEDAKKAWADWDALPPEVQKFFTPPPMPRPADGK